MAALFSQEKKQATCERHGDYESMGLIIGKNTHWSGCKECLQEEDAKRIADAEKRRAENEQRYYEARLNQAGIPLRFRSKSFDAYRAANDEMERAKSVAMEFAANFKSHRQNGTFLVFSGKPGTGKSHLAIAVAQAVMPEHTAMYTSAIDAVRKVRDTWRKDAEKTETEVLKMLASIDLLILDEIGVQYGTEAEQVTLFDIIDKRYRDMMPTILLTNLNAKGMKEFLGDRSYDRLREGGKWIAFDWESHRNKAAA